MSTQGIPVSDSSPTAWVIEAVPARSEDAFGNPATGGTVQIDCEGEQLSGSFDIQDCRTAAP